MAKQIILIDKNTGLKEKGYYGFSWTSLFFGPFPLLFRQEWLAFAACFGIVVLVTAITMGFGSIICYIGWGVFCNKWHLKKLIKAGYSFDETQPEEAVLSAKQYLGMSLGLKENNA